MKELVKISEAQIGNERINAVDARELHAFLELNENFSEWIKRYINSYNFVINSDFCRSTCLAENGRSMETYWLSLDMAKELSMISKTIKGRQARKYFIACEKALKELVSSEREVVYTKTVEKVNIPKGIDLSAMDVDIKKSISSSLSIGIDLKKAQLMAGRLTKEIHGLNLLELSAEMDQDENKISAAEPEQKIPEININLDIDFNMKPISEMTREEFYKHIERVAPKKKYKKR